MANTNAGPETSELAAVEWMCRVVGLGINLLREHEASMYPLTDDHDD